MFFCFLPLGGFPLWGGCLAAFLFPVCVLRALPVEGSILFIKGAGFCAGVVGCFVLGWWRIPFLGL